MIPSTALLNGRLALPDRVVENGAVVVENGCIVQIIEQAAAEEPAAITDARIHAAQIVDVGGRLIAPGLIDIHIHGACGHTFNEPTEEAYRTVTQENARRGVTSLLATTATDAVDRLAACLAFTAAWMKEEHTGAQILGSHVEGPYFAAAQAGAQDPKYLRRPDDGSVARLLAHARTIRLFTLAPELPGATSLIVQLQAAGITVAAGHSDATEDQLQDALAAGLRHMIHIWSGQSTVRRIGPWRKPGLLEVTLTDPRVTAEMIADNRHLPPTLMKLAAMCLGPDRLCIVSDATSGAGLPEGARFRMGEMEYEVHDGVGMLLDRTAFAGSTTLLNEMLPVLIDVVGIPVAAAVRMATLTPARVIGVDGRKGSLAVGKDADIAIFDDDFRAWGVLIGGRWTVEPNPAT